MLPHGYVELNWYENLLEVKVHGPFNIEGVNMAYEQIKQSVRNKALDAWYRVDYLDSDTLGSPEVMSVIGRNYKWSGPYNQCHGRVVCCSTSLQLSMMKKLANDINLPITVFTNIEDTKAFIKEQGWGSR